MRPMEASQLLGKGAPLIYINGRRMRDSSELEMLTSEELRTVEIITNPSSKYGSDVTSVILIKTRGKDAGFYANGAASVTASEKWSESGQLNLNYHTENGVTIFGDISYGNNGFKQERDYKELFSTDGKLPLDHITRTFATAKQRRESLTADGGINYESGKNSVGVKYTYSRTPSSHFSYQAQSLTDLREPGEISSSNNLNSQSYRHYLNSYAELALPAGIGLRVDMDYITGKNTGRDFTSEIETGNMIENTNRTTSDLFAGRIELQKEFGKWELNAGTDYTYTDNDQQFNSLTSAGNQMLQPATDRVIQHLYSTYLSANLNLNEHWSLSAGIRYEDTHIRYLRNGIKEPSLSKGYNDLHPNFGITFSSPVTLSVYYKAVTYRPAYSSLDNNFVYVTPTLWETGNPGLRSMKSQEISMSLSYKKFMLLVNGTHYKRKIGTVYAFDPDIHSNINYTVNLPSYSNLQIVAIQNFDIKFWHPTLQGLLYMQNLKYGVPERKYTTPLYRVIINNRFDIPGGVYGYLSFHLLGKGNIETQYSGGMWQGAITVSKSYRNWNFSLSANDIFGSWKQKFDTFTNTVSYSSRIKGASQSVSLTVRYKLNTKKGNYNGKTVREDEINRL